MATRTKTQRTRRPLPDLISLWVAQHRALSLGLAVAAAAVLFAIWTSISALPLDDARDMVIEWLGGSVYLVSAALILVALSLGSPRTRSLLRTDRRAQRYTTAAILSLIAAWGIAGAIAPDASLGGVSLSEHSAGGRVGAWFDSVIGWALIAAFVLVAAVVAAPSQARSAGRALGHQLKRAARGAGSWTREHGPGIVVAIGQGLWTALVVLARWLWIGLRWWLREVWDALRVIGRQIAERFRRPPQENGAAPVPQPASTPQSTPQSTPRPPSTSNAPEESWPPLTTTAAETEPEPEPLDAGEDAERQLPLVPADAEPPSTLRTLERTAADGWRLPPIDLLDEDSAETLRSDAEQQAQIIVETLASFGVDATVTQINEGPAITQFGVEPGWEVKTRQVPARDAAGAQLVDEYGRPQTATEEVSRSRVRVNRITRLADDLALALAAPSIRIEAPVPGQPIVGVEVPNADRRIVGLRSLVASEEFQLRAADGGLPIALGRDVTGKPVIADLTRMPHVLIAGATGSGKSVCINTIITSLLMQKSPEEIRLVLVDPKRVELTGYASAPHLAFSRVVTEPDEVVSVLGVVVAEMDRRYRRLEDRGARNIVAYNALADVDKPLPYWVVVLDELADMMMAAAAEVEGQLVRLAQLARAVGIHLVVATQRPSVDVVTGLIKANFPTRIAFATTSQTDARVIMDRTGAEKLMGRGDMLFMSSDTIQPRRVQGTYVSDAEIERILESWSPPEQELLEESRGIDNPSATGGSLDAALEEMAADTASAASELAARRAQSDLRTLTATLDTVLEAEQSDTDEPDIVLDEPAGGADNAPELDTRLSEAAELARDFERVSASLLQRRMRLGRPRAERLIEQLEQAGVVAPAEGGTSRRVLRC